MSEWIAKLDVYLHDEKCFGVNLLEKIEKKTNCPRKFIVLGMTICFVRSDYFVIDQ